MDPVRQQKVNIRKGVNHRLAALEPDAIQKASDEILAKLLETVWWKNTSLVLTYLSIRREVATDRMIDAAHEAGKEVAVPCLDGKNMLFYSLNPAGQEYTFNWYGIREPEREGSPFQAAEMAGNSILLVCPGVAFDRKLFRLGRGGGYYDRFIRELRRTPRLSFTAVGIFFHAQLEESIPTSPWDERLDAVITERETILSNGLIGPRKPGGESAAAEIGRSLLTSLIASQLDPFQPNY